MAHKMLVSSGQTLHQVDGFDALRLGPGGLLDLNGGHLAGLRSKIINGDMSLNQRLSGIVTISNGSGFAVDRFICFNNNTTQAYNIRQDTDAPAGFTNSLLATVTTAGTIATGDRKHIEHRIEGFNVSDFYLGNVSARAFTLSFWVKVSVAGTFGGAVANGVFTRAYPFTFTVNVANVWEWKTITIPGDTAGAWAKDNTVGLRVYWALGVGSSGAAPAGAWVAGDIRTATGARHLLDAAGATYRITGVQVEPGLVATPFEQRQYGLELVLAQRYYERFKFPGIFVHNTASIQYNVPCLFKVRKRGIPVVSIGTSSTNSCYSTAGGSFTPTNLFAGSASEDGCQVIASHTSSAFGGIAPLDMDATAEL